MDPLSSQKKILQLLANVPVTSVEKEEDAESLIHYVGKNVVADQRLQVWDVEVVTLHPLVVSGYVSSRWVLRTLEVICAELEIELDTSRVIELPDPSLGEHRFGQSHDGQGSLHVTALKVSTSEAEATKSTRAQRTLPSGHMQRTEN